MANFPKTLFVRSETEEDVTYFVAERNLDDAVEEDGVTTVAVYRLESRADYRKVSQEVKKHS
jgi:hypothetical protein